MSVENVKVGHYVNVVFGGGEEEFIHGTVKYVPSSPGDVWVIENDDCIFYCERPLYIVLRKDQGEG